MKPQVLGEVAEEQATWERLNGKFQGAEKMKEMESTLLVKAFGNDLRFAGYRTIVDTLVFYGQASTGLTPKMDFGPMARFLRFKQEGGIVRIFFDHDAAMTSLEFEDTISNALAEAKANVAHARNELLEAEKTVSAIMDVETTVKELRNVHKES